jgi:drug/metabolite transporter (DMT)-like permease
MVKRYGIGAILAISATILIWSTTFAGLVVALKHFSPGHLLFLRWSLAALLFAGYGVTTRMRLPKRADVPVFLVAGLLGFGIYQSLLVFGQQGVSASMAGFLINMNPVFTTLIAVALGRDSANGFTWLGLGACMGGLVLMGSAHGGFGQIGWSAGLVVLAALSFAGYTVISKPLFSRYSALEVTTYCVIAGTLPLLVFAPGSMAAVASASPAQLATVLFLALFPGSIAYLLWSRSVAAFPPGVASRFLYLVPVIGVPIAWLWVGEAPQALTLIGGAITLAGVALATVKRAPWRPRVAEPVLAEPRSTGALVSDAA